MLRLPDACLVGTCLTNLFAFQAGNFSLTAVPATSSSLFSTSGRPLFDFLFTNFPLGMCVEANNSPHPWAAAAHSPERILPPTCRCLDVMVGATPILSLSETNSDPQLFQGNVAFSRADRADIVRAHATP